MKIILAAIEDKLYNAWLNYFNLCTEVEVIFSDITKLKCDAIVSPANSFGFMDGGLDYHLSERFGWDLEEKLQKQIRNLPEGELLVGRTLVIETNDALIPYLISAPTMRIPTNFNIPTSVNAYLAMKAILITLLNDDRINSVAIPGLCTGVGGIKPQTCALQMFKAFEEIILGNKQKFTEFGQAQKYHWKLNQDSMIWTN